MIKSYVSPRTLVSAWAVAVATASATFAQPLVTAYTHGQEQLFRLELDVQATPVPVIPAGSTGLDDVCALVEGPGGTFYAAVDGSDELWQIDRETLSTVVIGDLGIDLSILSDLASDAAGQLWLVTRDTLHSVDPATGQATAVGNAAELKTIAVDGDTLYGIDGSDGPYGPWTLVALDPSTGDQTPLTALELAPEFNGLFLFGPWAMDFDDRGGLWVLTQYGSGGLPDPPVVQAVVHYFAEPSSGSADSVSMLNSLSFWKSLVVTGTAPPVVDIPTASHWGLIALALMLATAGLVVGRYKRRRV